MMCLIHTIHVSLRYVKLELFKITMCYETPNAFICDRCVFASAISLYVIQILMMNFYDLDFSLSSFDVTLSNE